MFLYYSFFRKRVFNFIYSTVILQFIFSSAAYALLDDTLKTQITSAIFKATKYFDDSVGVDGAYVWTYKTDLSRRWGEMEAYPSMAWLQGPGTVGMGNTFLDIYDAIQDEYYYELAMKAAQVLMKGQLDCGGWNYMIDLAGEESINKWYNTIGKNGWRLEEFQHYYGNATFDDGVTSEAAMFLLRVYLMKHDQNIKQALDRAIVFTLQSQYPIGGWPQRYPPKDQFNKNGHPDYTSYYTFNDEVIWNNIKFLILCYATLDKKELWDPIYRGMNFFLVTQQPDPQGGWALQYSLDLQPAEARSYEPKSLDPRYTIKHIEMLIKFYEMTGDKKYLSRIPDALKWIESVKMSEQEDGVWQVPKSVEIGTNKAIFMHRKGSNVEYGEYYYNYNRNNDLVHSPGLRTINTKLVMGQFEKAQASNLNEQKQDSISIPGLDRDLPVSEIFNFVKKYLIPPSENWEKRWVPDLSRFEKAMSQLDSEGRWLTSRVYISNPYIGDPLSGDSDTDEYAHTQVGDKYDTSPYENNSDEKFISTRLYIRNVHILLYFLAN